MIKEIIASGKDIIEAKENARAALGAGPLDDVQFEIIHAGSKGIFGIIGVKPAQVKAFIEIPDPVERRQRREKPNKEKKQGGEPKKNKDGSLKAKTSHTLNPVPCIIYDNANKDKYTVKEDKGQFGLSNVAATMVNLMGYEAPAMWDESVIDVK